MLYIGARYWIFVALSINVRYNAGHLHGVEDKSNCKAFHSSGVDVYGPES